MRHHTLFNHLINIKNSKFWKSVSILVSGTTLSQLLGFLSMPIISRLYLPTDIGEKAIFLSTASILVYLVSLGLNSAVMIADNEIESDGLVRVALISSFVLSTFLLISSIAFSSIIQLFQTRVDYILACILIYILILLNQLQSILSVMMNRRMINKALFLNSLITAISTFLIAVPLGLLGFGLFGLIASYIIAQIISIAQMLTRYNPFRRFEGDFSYIQILKKYKKFVFFQMPANFIGNLAVQLPTQIFSARFGNDILASYTMDETILGIPSRLIANPINIIYFRTATELAKNNEFDRLSKFTFSLVMKIMAIGSIPIVVCILWGEKLFGWFLGDVWSEAGTLAGYLIVPYVFSFGSTCVAYCRVVLGRMKINLFLGIVKVIIIALALYLGIQFTGNLIYTIRIYSISISIYFIFEMTMNFFIMKKYYLRYIIIAIFYIFLAILLWLIL